MNLTPEANDIAMTVAGKLIRFLDQGCPGWDVGFLRFVLGESGPAATASCVMGAEVAVIEHPGVFDILIERSKALFDAQKLSKGVVLFVVGASRQVEIRFDLQNLERWKICREGGGVPEGL